MRAFLANLLADGSGITAVDYAGLIAASSRLLPSPYQRRVGTNLTSVFNKTAGKL